MTSLEIFQHEMQKPDGPVKCACGKPLHYTDLAMKEVMEDMIAKRGDYLIVHCQGRAYCVQRHFIALHGLRAADLETLADQGIIERLERS